MMISAHFLFEIGLQRNPPIATILGLASISNLNPERRKIALDYFIDRFDMLYHTEYSVSKFKDIAFIPAIEAGGTQFLGKPSEVLFVF